MNRIKIRINPVYQKELTTSVRSVKTVLIILGYNGLLAFLGLSAFYLTFQYRGQYIGTVHYSAILSIYSIITAVEFALVIFTVPALTASAISAEREKQTLEILLTTKLSPGQIITGKLASSISMMILLAFSSLPVLALVFSIGGVTLRNLAEFMLLIVVTAIYIGSIGIFLSALYKKTTAATVSTYGVLLILGLGTLAILYGILMIKELRISRLFTGGYGQPAAQVGEWIYILLINPVVTFISMIERQTGMDSGISSVFYQFEPLQKEVRDLWFYYSILLQLGISGILLWASSRLLNPLRKRRGAGKGKKR